MATNPKTGYGRGSGGGSGRGTGSVSGGSQEGSTGAPPRTNALIEDMRRLGISASDASPLAKKVAPGGRAVGQPVPLATNVYGLLTKKIPVFRYEVTITAHFPGARERLLTKRSSEDYVSIDRKSKCADVMEMVVNKNPAFFGQRKGLVYDRQSILYSVKKFPITSKMQDFSLMQEEIPDTLGFDSCERIAVTVKEVTEEFQLTLDDFSHVMPSSFGIDRSLQQFLEIATSQEAMNNRERHVTFGATKNYLLNPLGEGFEPADFPELGSGKFLAAGAEKSVRFIEGPKGPGNMNCSTTIDTKKTAFHEVQGVHAKAAGILGINTPEQLMNETPSATQNVMLRSQMKGLFVEIRNNQARVFQIAGITSTSALTQAFKNRDGATVTVADYFASKGHPLNFPNLPLLIEKVRGKENYYPMELCVVCKFQRVTLQQQTPAQMEKMIKACARPPVVRQHQNLLNVKALELHDSGAHNATLQEFQIGVTQRTLSVTARQLPSPRIEYGERMVVNVSPEGTWRVPGKKPSYILPAKIGIWAIYAIAVRQRDRFDLPQLTEFAKMLMREAQSRGMQMENPAECEVLPSDQKTITNKVQIAAKHGAQFIFFVQHDHLKIHKQIKLLEVKCGILTQDVKMSTANDCVVKGKPQTMENLVNKMNVKNGGINYNLLLENPVAQQWLGGNRLIVGFGASHPPPLLAQEIARGIVPTSPSVVGYAANINKHPIDFVGDYVFQESRRTENIVVLPPIVERLTASFKESRGVLPDHVIVYRGGIADGQFAMVLKFEVPAIRKTLNQANGGTYKPKLTVIVTNKRHNIRLFPVEMNASAKPSDQNIKPGTVVDQRLVHPSYFEFYLNSHRALQGTAKTPRYTVLYDDSGMSSDEIQGLSHALCFDHQIVNLSISLPAPVYIADRYAQRGRMTFTASAGEHESSGDSSDSKGETPMDIAKLNSELTYSNTAMKRMRVNA